MSIAGDSASSMKTMHLFAGGGGGMYADLILGHTPTVAVEWEKAACDVLRARKEEWWPDCEIIERCISRFSGTPYKGRVGAIHAGWPCQGHSICGPRTGLEDDRSGMWKEVPRIADEAGRPILFLENSSRVFDTGFGTIAGDLADLGYSLRWLCLRASDVGAPHQRLRFWGIAYTSSHRLQGGIQGFYGDQAQSGIQARGEVARVPYLEAPTWWETQFNMASMVDGVANRKQWEAEIKMLGNGQVPLQAAYAWVMLGGPVDEGVLP